MNFRRPKLWWMLLAAIWFILIGLEGLIPAISGIHIVLDILAIAIGVLIFLER